MKQISVAIAIWKILNVFNSGETKLTDPVRIIPPSVWSWMAATFTRTKLFVGVKDPSISRPSSLAPNRTPVALSDTGAINAWQPAVDAAIVAATMEANFTMVVAYDGRLRWILISDIRASNGERWSMIWDCDEDERRRLTNDARWWIERCTVRRTDALERAGQTIMSVSLSTPKQSLTPNSPCNQWSRLHELW